MPALIEKLFSEPKVEAIRKLWEDAGSRLLVEREIGKILLSNGTIIDNLPLTQLMFVFSLSPFADNVDECYNVAEIVFWGATQTDILPYTSQHCGRELAFRCLVSLSLFKKAMVEKNRRHGYPSVDFYRGVGISTFKSVGMPDIGSHFRQWENFIGEVSGL